MSDHPRVVAIIQARMGSTRLPGKTLMDLGGEPVVDHVIRRATKAKLVDTVVVAIPDVDTDDVLAEHLETLGQSYARGDADDVLSRYHLAAEQSGADVIVRITADCPLIDPRVIDETVEAFFDDPQVDYCANIIERTYPIGMDTEVFTRAALKRAFVEAERSEEREHVTPYFYQNPEEFELRNVEAPPDLTWPEARLTVDEIADLQLLQALVDRVGLDAALAEYLDALRADDGLRRQNAHVEHRHVPRAGA